MKYTDKDIERRQALCRAIFTLNDEAFHFMELCLIIAQKQHISSMIGEKELPIWFDTPYTPGIKK